ncbi:MAG: GMC family oxidoreductase N-terminal domain-containing protein [Gammaproteobacteria bacterium]|nr:GMC family oxidoreductase N-terminal domain-containing protein [Gammaproteobacteria bacterium]
MSDSLPADLPDIIVIGGGSAGCAMAARLADAGRSVVLLEAGKSDARLRLRIPALSYSVVSNAEYDWGYPGEPDPSIGGRADKWPAGRRLGGGSAVNGLIYVRGHAWDYDNWAALGATGWSAAEVWPYFRRTETFEDGGNAYRGACGPIHVQRNRMHYPIVDAYIDAAVAAGIERNPDHNGALSGQGTDYAQATLDRGLRCSSAQGYLRDWRGPRRPMVITEASARRILVEGGRAVGVEWIENGRSRTLRARNGVVLSAGTLNSPRLLMLSGVGPKAELERLGIPVRADLPGVGANLQEHVGAHIILRVNSPTINSDARGLAALGQGLAFLARRRGVLTSSMCHAQAFVKTSAAERIPDVQVSLTAFAFRINEIGRAELLKVPSVSITVSLARPKGRGRLTLRSADPAAPPRIQHQLLGGVGDLERLARGLTMARAILAQPPMARHILEELMPGPAVDAAALPDYLRRASIPLLHPVGTCRMGQDPMAVVDPNLRVRGIANLWIADASVFPALPVGNTNATAIMIGDKGADHVLKTLR